MVRDMRQCFNLKRWAEAGDSLESELMGSVLNLSEAILIEHECPERSSIISAHFEVLRSSVKLASKLNLSRLFYHQTLKCCPATTGLH